MQPETLLARIGLALLVSAPLAAQGDLIYYPFLLGSGTSVTNLAQTSKPGTLTTTNTSNKGWVAGQGGGSALSGRDSTSTYSYVDSGLNQGTASSFLAGDFTVAFFMKQRIASGTLANYYFGGVGSFRMFVGGVAYEGLYLRAWGGAPADLILRGPTNKTATEPFFDMRGEAAKRWVHVALVVDSTNLVATWYIDGGPFHSIPLTAKANVTGTGNFRVGMQTSTSTASDFDIDDFRLSNRAAEPHEIAQWASAKLQPDKTVLSISNQDKQNLSLDSGVANKTRFYWIFGSASGTYPPTVLGSTPIPLVLDPYTLLALDFTNTPVFANFRGILDANGRAKASFNIPASVPAGGVGLTLYHAYLVYDAANNYHDVSNPTVLKLVK